MATARDERRRAARLAPRGADQAGPLSRELITIKLIRFVDYLSRAASLAFPRASGLSDFEWRVLAWSCELPGPSLNDLAAMLHRGAAQVSRSVKKLVAAGLLDRVRRRGGPGVLIGPTALGRTVYRPLAALARQRNSEIIAGLTVREIRVLERCIAAMMANVRAQLDREQRLQARRRHAASNARGAARARQSAGR